MSKILLIAAILAVAFCNLHLNIKYRDFVNGEGLFTEAKAREIYSLFHLIALGNVETSVTNVCNSNASSEVALSVLGSVRIGHI